jgi:hypothetical protein
MTQRAEGSGTRAEAKARGIKQRHYPGGIAAAHRLGIVEASGSDSVLFERKIKPDLVCLR